MNIDLKNLMGLVKEIDPNSKLFYKVEMLRCISYYMVNGFRGFTVAYHYDKILDTWTTDSDTYCDDRFWSLIEMKGVPTDEDSFYWASHQVSMQNNCK